MTGKISIDFPGDLGTTGFDAYARSIGIDTTRYIPIGLEIFGIECQNMLEEVEIRLLAQDTEDNNNIVRFNEVDNLANFLRNIHRLLITVVTDGEIEGKVLTREIENNE